MGLIALSRCEFKVARFTSQCFRVVFRCIYHVLPPVFRWL
jgi:hypothetical protein